MLAECGIWSDDEGRFDRFLILPFDELFEGDSFLIKENVLRFEEAITVKGDFDFLAELSAARLDDIQLGREGFCCQDGEKAEKADETRNHGFLG